MMETSHDHGALLLQLLARHRGTAPTTFSIVGFYQSKSGCGWPFKCKLTWVSSCPIIIEGRFGIKILNYDTLHKGKYWITCIWVSAWKPYLLLGLGVELCLMPKLTLAYKKMWTGLIIFHKEPVLFHHSSSLLNYEQLKNETLCDL